MDLAPILVGTGATCAAGYITYSYRNTLACTLTSISAKFAVENGKLASAKVGEMNKHLTVERLKIVNYGFRRLSDVELHVPIRSAVIFLEVTELPLSVKMPSGWHSTMK